MCTWIKDSVIKLPSVDFRRKARNELKH